MYRVIAVCSVEPNRKETRTEKMSIPILFANFNNANRAGRLRLNCTSSIADMENLQLQEGIIVIVTDEESLQTTGTLVYSQEEDSWMVKIDWDKIDHC